MILSDSVSKLLVPPDRKFQAALAFLLPQDRVTNGGTIKSELSIKFVQNDEQIVYGEVYAPYMIDSHGDMMLPDGVRVMAHRFLAGLKNQNIDLMHNNKAVHATVVESFIARDDDPLYAPGAWVLAVKIYDPAIWADVKAGKLNGYSFEAMVSKYEADVTYDYSPVNIGFVEENDGHEHSFWVEIGDDGRVIGGFTSPGEDGHVHKIQAGTATELSNSHAHRYFLNEMD